MSRILKIILALNLLVLAVLALGHIVSIFLFWGWI